MNPNIHRYHQQHSQQVQHRIDLLIGLYNATIDSIRELVSQPDLDNPIANVDLKLRINKLIVEILDGINDNFGETAPNIRALCLFVLDQVTAGDVAGLNSSIQVLTLLCEGFEGVRNEAIEVEQSDLGQVILPNNERCLDALT